jgi:glycerophosphoryl diester phosphodiesterase
MQNPSESITVQGHRGFRGKWPENTAHAFIKAIEAGADVLECDVVCTADNRIVITHDPFLNHEIWAHPDGTPVSEQEAQSLNIYRMTLDSLMQFRLGSFPHPRFSEQQPFESTVLPLSKIGLSVIGPAETAGFKPIPWNVEIKSRPEWDNVYHPAPDEYVRLFLENMDQNNVPIDYSVQSFDPRILKSLHAQRPEVKCVLLSEDPEADAATEIAALGFTPAAYSPHFSMVTPELIEYCAIQGIDLVVWTVNEEEDIRNMIGLGVRNIISDYPDRVIAIRNDLRQ